MTKISTHSWPRPFLLRETACHNLNFQVEGAFGVLKQDMEFRRFLLRGKVKVQTEFLLLAMAFNINKLHNKIQSNRCEAYLHLPKVA